MNSDLIAPPQSPADESGEDTVSRARHALAAAIRRGDYRPSQRLIESEIAAELGVSRGTLRAAFIALEQQNYITLEHNRGARVRQFSPGEALEILETREILEAAATGLAAQRVTDHEIDHLEDILRRMVDADGALDGPGYSLCNREFHAAIIAAAKQPTLSRFIRATPYPLVMQQYRDIQSKHPRPGSLREHQAIFSAIATRNRAAAEAAMRHHIGAARHALTLREAAERGDWGTAETPNDAWGPSSTDGHSWFH